MAGKIKQAIDEIIRVRSRGDRAAAATTRTKILLKGVDPDIYHTATPDNPEILERLRLMALDMGVSVPGLTQAPK